MKTLEQKTKKAYELEAKDFIPIYGAFRYINRVCESIEDKNLTPKEGVEQYVKAMPGLALLTAYHPLVFSAFIATLFLSDCIYRL